MAREESVDGITDLTWKKKVGYDELLNKNKNKNASETATAQGVWFSRASKIACCASVSRIPSI